MVNVLVINAKEKKVKHTLRINTQESRYFTGIGHNRCKARNMP